MHNNNFGQNIPEQSVSLWSICIATLISCAYMQHIQRIQYLQDTVNRLQVENTLLRAERSAIQ